MRERNCDLITLLGKPYPRVGLWQDNMRPHLAFVPCRDCDSGMSAAEKWEFISGEDNLVAETAETAETAVRVFRRS